MTDELATVGATLLLGDRLLEYHHGDRLGLVRLLRRVAMFAWLRKIKRINIFGFELEFDHSGDTRPDPPVVITPPPPLERDPRRPGTHLPPSLTVRGVVVGTIGKDLGLRVENDDEARKFWHDQRIDTKLDWAGAGPPIFSIGRKQDVERCRPGDAASMTITVQERAGGKRGVKTIDFRLLNGG